MILPSLRRRRRSRPIYLDRFEITHLLRRSLLFLLVVFALHVLAMMVFERMTPGDAVWLTLTTATTVGYGDLAATTPLGRTATVVLLFIGGIFILGNFAGEYFDMRRARRQRMIKGLWEWNVERHILIINTPSQGGTEYFQRLIGQLRRHDDYRDCPIVLLTRQYPDGLPQALRDLGVVHHTGSSDSYTSLGQVHPEAARAIVVISKEEYDVTSDALTFDILHRLRDTGIGSIPVIAECIADENRPRFRAAGATQVIRPSRAYPEILVRALVAPGSETVLENLFDYEGDHTRRYDLSLEGVVWGDLAAALIREGCGTPLAYIDLDGQAICNPAPDRIVEGQGIILLVRSEAIPEEQSLRQVVATAAQA